MFDGRLTLPVRMFGGAWGGTQQVHRQMERRRNQHLPACEDAVLHDPEGRASVGLNSDDCEIVVSET